MERGRNKYRRYSIGQLAIVNLIRTLQGLDMTLDEIKSLKEQRTPERVRDMLLQLMGKIDDKVVDWLRSRQLVLALLNAILPALGVDEEAITVQPLSREPMVLGDPNDYSGGDNDFDALLHFYAAAHKKHPDLELNYPVWAVYLGERIRAGDWKWPDRYYFYYPRGEDARPAALYAIGYQRGGYGDTGELYARLIDYINKNGYEICGDAYEEYPLNEICVADDANYLIRAMITVREKG